MKENLDKKIIVTLDVEDLDYLVEQILLSELRKNENQDNNFSKVFPINWTENDLEELFYEIVDSGLWSDFLHCEIKPIIQEKFSHLWDKKN